MKILIFKDTANRTDYYYKLVEVEPRVWRTEDFVEDRRGYSIELHEREDAPCPA